MCARNIDVTHVSTILFREDFGTVLTVWYFFLSLSYRIYSIVHLPDISAVKNLQEKKKGNCKFALYNLLINIIHANIKIPYVYHNFKHS